jgi:hypothetical protein
VKPAGSKGLVWNQFRDLHQEVDRLGGPPCAHYFLDVLDQRRRELPAHVSFVQIGYGGHLQKRGVTPARPGMVERKGRFSRRTFIRGAHWTTEHRLVTVDPGGGWRQDPIRQPRRHPDVAYHCARGGCKAGGKGLANGYAASHVIPRGGVLPKPKPASTSQPEAEERRPDGRPEGWKKVMEAANAGREPPHT